MAILLIILSVTLGLAWRALAARQDENEMLDVSARASVLVLASLGGLLALGVTYGNVLGAHLVP
jgi:hypothetical protein